MKGYTCILRSQTQRDLCHGLIEKAPQDYVVQVRPPNRTGEQNDKMWAMIGDISRAKPMARRHTPDDWKAIIMNACGWETQFLEGLDGRPFPSGFRSSNMTKAQMSTMIEWMYAFGAEHNIRWSDNGNLD